MVEYRSRYSHLGTAESSALAPVPRASLASFRSTDDPGFNSKFTKFKNLKSWFSLSAQCVMLQQVRTRAVAEAPQRLRRVLMLLGLWSGNDDL